MALSGLGFVGTIEEDEDVSVASEDTDSDEEALKPIKKRQKKYSEFESGFRFTEKDGANDDSFWNIDAYLRKKRVTYTTLDEKISKMRKEKKKKAEKGKTEDQDLGEGDVEEEPVNKKENHSDVQNGDDESESDAESLSDDELKADTLRLKKQHEKTLERMRKKRQRKDESESEDEIEDMATDNNDVIFQDAPPLDETMGFQEMNLSRPLLKAINAMNFVHPTPIQVATIPVALLAKDICACAATGTGKTAAFMLPVLERLLYKPKQAAVTRVLVLVPTRELGIQVHAVSRQLAQFTDVEICLAVGGLDIRIQEAALRQNPDIVIATPGRLIDHLHNAPSFNIGNIEILILDEADRMLDEYFEEQMKEIIKMCSVSRQTMLFSATMTDKVKDLASVSLKNPMKLFVNENTDVAYNLRQEFIRIRDNREGDREAITAALCTRTFHNHCIVFVQTKVQCHRLHIILGLLGLNVGELHGNLSQAQRLEALRRFKDAQIDILLATDLAARGLDIEGVKTIINFTMPNTVKHYVHRVGRTARAGKSGRAVSLVGEKERKMLKEIVKRARNPVKSRVVPPEIIGKYRDKVKTMEEDIKKILILEEEEKELRVSEMKVNKAKALIEHHEEIHSRPKRTWFQSHGDRMLEKEKLMQGILKNKPSKKKRKMERKPETAEERAQFEIRKSQEYSIRAAKRASKPKKITVFDEDAPSNTGGKKKRQGKRGTQSSFEKELTNTSTRAVKQLRHRPSSHNKAKTFEKKAPQKSKGGKFKSKQRYKRRK